MPQYLVRTRSLGVHGSAAWTALAQAPGYPLLLGEAQVGRAGTASCSPGMWGWPKGGAWTGNCEGNVGLPFGQQSLLLCHLAYSSLSPALSR